MAHPKRGEKGSPLLCSLHLKNNMFACFALLPIFSPSSSLSKSFMSRDLALISSAEPSVIGLSTVLLGLCWEENLGPVRQLQTLHCVSTSLCWWCGRRDSTHGPMLNQQHVHLMQTHFRRRDMWRGISLWSWQGYSESWRTEQSPKHLKVCKHFL